MNNELLQQVIESIESYGTASDKYFISGIEPSELVTIAKIIELYNDAKLKQIGELCFTVEYMTDEELVDKLNTRANEYAAKQNKALSDWKESAMNILSEIDLQAIGKELGVPLGASVSENLLEKIKAYRMDGMKKALAKAATIVMGEYLNVNNTPLIKMITDPKNLEV